MILQSRPKEFGALNYLRSKAYGLAEIVKIMLLSGDIIYKFG